MDRLSYEPRNLPAFDEMLEFGAYAAHFPGADPEDAAATFRKWITAVRDSGSQNAVFVDTTMIHTLDRLLRGDNLGVNPAALLDLANGVSALILADTVFCFESSETDPVGLNELLGVGPAFVPIPSGSWGPDVSSRIRSMWLHAMEYVERIGSGEGAFAEDAAEVRSAWETLLGVKLDWSTWGTDAIDYRNRGYGEQSCASELYETAVSVYRRGMPSVPGVDRDRVDDFILESNLRSAFNQAFAYALRLDYVPNAFRMPYQGYLYAKGHAERQHFLRFVDAKSRKRFEEIFGTEREMRLPLFLSAILARADTLEDVRSLIADWRLRAEGFRRRRGELNEAVARQDAREGQKILDALAGEDGPGLLKLALAAGGVAAIGAAGAVIAGIEGASLGILLALHGAAEVMVPSSIAAAAEATCERAFRPRGRILVRAARASAALGDARGKIQKIWKTGPIVQSYADWLNRAAKLDC